MLRAPYRTNSQVGMIPEVGAYLDLPPGQLADPESVLKWLECLRIYMYINYESRIKEIIGYDGVLKEYPKIEAPENPDADAGVVEMTLWELALEEYEDARESLERDRLKLHILLLGQMSEGSRNRIEQSTAGEKALKEGDPLGLLSAVIATHVINSGFGATYDVVTAETNLYTIKMLPKEDLGRYFDRFGRMLYVKSVAYRMAGVKMQKDSDGLLAVMFIIKLNHHYSGYINNFMNKLRDWPTTLSEAYQDAANYWYATSESGARNTATLISRLMSKYRIISFG